MPVSSFELIFQFLASGFVFSIDHHLHLAFLRADHHALLAHTTHHVKGALRLSTEGHLQHILLDAPLEGLFQGAVDLEETVGRA
jgi:hypothetical protein